MANELRGQSNLIETWTFVNDADRLSPTISGSTQRYVYQDVGKIGYQQDTGDYWRLISPTPTWQFVGQTYVTSGLPSPEMVFADEDGDLVIAG